MSTELPPLSPLLVDSYQHYLQLFSERCGEHQSALQQQCQQPDVAAQLASTWSCSQFAAEWSLRQPQHLLDSLTSGELQRDCSQQQYQQQLATQLADISEVELFERELRLFRNRQMFRLIWRDVNRLASLQQTLTEITALAEVCLDAALDFHHCALAARYGEPMLADSNGELQAQRMVVIGMGKLGAGELNLSSDIDLMFAYPASGETEGVSKTLSNQEFFIRLGRKLIHSLDKITVDGFVFRVDMRLRPYGESGALALSFAAMEEYYQDQGRDWERYAMIKARCVAGDRQRGEQLLADLKPFVYRRYIDFTAIESLRAMKKMIRQEVKRRQLHNDVKLGEGGIREIEFIAQSVQLLRGGRDRVLQERSLLKVLQQLLEGEFLPPQVVRELHEAYVFLRRSEHGIQAFRDQQTQQLPEQPLAQQALAWFMGCTDWDSYCQLLQQHRQCVSEHFSQVIADPEEEPEHRDPSSRWRECWDDVASEEDVLQWLQQAGHQQPDEVLRQLLQLRDSSAVRRMQAIGRQRLDQLMPLLLEAVLATDNPSNALLRCLPLVEAVLRRTAYLLLLVESPAALQQLVILCAASPMIAEQLARHPVLLDELLDTRTLYYVPDKDALRDELQQQLLRLPWDDLEAHMEALRYFRLAHILRVAASEVTGRLPLMKVSDYLTYIAEVVLEHVLDLAWHNLESRYGRPANRDGSSQRRFVIVAYGKLGGIELGHSSDLDLVFVHDADSSGYTDGDKAVDNNVFFTRLGQRIIHILNTRTPLGPLYEVDMRLRPSGDSGMLVSSLTAFTEYQQKNAWTWEHQALVRARVVAGDTQLGEAFQQVRLEVLAQPRDLAQLQQDVVSMRDKMREHLLPKGLRQAEPPVFHLKQDRGAIVDIEFMVQYAVLAWSHSHPSLGVYTDNIRILEALQAEGLFAEEEVRLLTEAYKAYRISAHRLSLEQLPGQVPLAEVEQFADVVTTKWQTLFAD